MMIILIWSKKGIEPHGIRVHKGKLVIPIWSDEKLQSLQFIAPDDDKRFLSGGRTKGGYYEIGKPENAETICIAEGFATAASIREATDYPVVIAFNANNLEQVAKTVRDKSPESTIIICADDDTNKENNPGMTSANKAARAIGAKVAIPKFREPRPEGATDFNDMAELVGLEEVARVIKAAKQPDHDSDTRINGWPAPLPLEAKIEAESYPLDALPETVKAAVEEVHAFVKAPIPLVASSALAALSLAAQAHVDVKRAEKLVGPSSLFLLTIADSGERKSTCDKLFMQAIREYEAQQEEDAKPEIQEYKAAMEAWGAECSGIKDTIRQLSRQGESTQDWGAKLHKLEKDKPEPPRVPRLIYVDVTSEELKWKLAKVWPSGGVITGEAGLVFGAHSMGKDSIMRNLATFNQLWDGMDICHRSADFRILYSTRGKADGRFAGTGDSLA